MKEWTKPEIQELDICNTEHNYATGSVPDSYITDTKGNIEGVYEYSR